MTLRTVEYVDMEGRRWLRGLPEASPDSQANIGVPLGPPSLEELNLPLHIEVALHNQLFARGIFSEQDARSRATDIHSALMTALRVDVNRILAVYQGTGAVNGTTESPESEPVAGVVDRRPRRALA